MSARRAAALGALTTVILGGCQLVSGLAGIEVAATTGTGGSTGQGGALPVYPCSPDPTTCPEGSSPCLALADNAGLDRFTLRISQLNFTKPDQLYGGSFKNFLYSGGTLNLTRCKLFGLGTFNWLLHFDAEAGLLRTGAGKPVADPSAGFSFTDEMVPSSKGPVQVAPVDLPLLFVGASGSFSAKDAPDLLLPLYLDEDAKLALVLPIHELRVSGTLSPDRQCIGAYNPSVLDPMDNCIGDDEHLAYVDGGSLDGYLPLEEVDTIIAGGFGQSLCVLLSGDADAYGDGGFPIIHCKRDANGNIVFPGDWCAKKNSPAKDECADAMRLFANFAASSVTLLP